MSKAARLRVGGQRAKNAFVSETQRDAKFFKEREHERSVNAEKTKRLRALRLEKEAADKEAAEAIKK
jgi:hypothetical protein